MNPVFSPKRRKSSVVSIGNLSIGGVFPIAVQSMCNTKTSDVKSSISQISSLCAAGADLVRLTVPTMSDVESLKSIHAFGFPIPICADVHFNSSIAFKATEMVEKVRINPGNFAKESDVENKFIQLLNLAKKNNVALRIGVNHGSLSSYMMERYGDTPRGMVESAMEYLRIAKKQNFENIVVSLKSSNPRVMVESYRLCVDMMDVEDIHYPLHLGVTEAGEGLDGRIRSAVGIGALLCDGIGDTIRVSLTEDPVEEVPVGKVLADYFFNIWLKTEPIISNIAPAYNPLVFKRRLDVKPVVVGEGGDFKTIPETWYKIDSEDDINSCPDDVPVVVSTNKVAWVGYMRYLISLLVSRGKRNPVILHKNYHDISNFDIIAAAEMGALLIDGLADGVWIEKNGETVHSSLGYSILQATRLRITTAEIISCPGCGRTQYDLQTIAKAVKERFSKYTGLKIAVMGCIVNGPGEMADADWGYVGAGGGKVSIYKGHSVVVNKVDQSEALDILENLINENK